MSIKTVICDDNEKARYIIVKYIKKLNIPEIDVIAEAQNGYELVEICKKQNPDLILLDIDMPFINGIDTAKKIIEFLPDTFFIFITAFSSFSLDAFEIHAFDYILKPVSIERLEKSLLHIIQKKIESISDSSNNVTFISKHNLYSIKQNDILFIERTGRKSLIHTRNKKLEIYESLNNLQNKLNSNIFFRSHNGYIINKHAIEKINKSFGEPYEVVFKNYCSPAYISRRKMLDLYNCNLL